MLSLFFSFLISVAATCQMLFLASSRRFEDFFKWHIQQRQQVWLWWSKQSSTDCTNCHIDKVAQADLSATMSRKVWTYRQNNWKISLSLWEEGLAKHFSNVPTTCFSAVRTCLDISKTPLLFLRFGHSSMNWSATGLPSIHPVVQNAKGTLLTPAW